MQAIKFHVLAQARHQSGAALIVSLLILTVMTVIGVSSMQATSLEERMTGNMRDRSLAFEAAEAALAAGEALLDRGSALPAFNANGTGGFYSTAAAPPNWKSSSTWSNANNVGIFSDGTLAKVHSTPTFIIEQLAYATGGSSGGSLQRGRPVPPATTSNTYYRVTARGTGGTDNAEVILQSFFRR